MPLGQVPVLEVDGSTKLAQTMTILRYIANRHGEHLYLCIYHCLITIFSGDMGSDRVGRHGLSALRFPLSHSVTN